MIGEELGKYRVLAPIGKGGMASVFVGEHTLLGHKVAIKVLQKRHLENAAIERRFFNEAKVIASISHPNIVEIFDFGRGDGGGAFIVMELLEGQTLRSRIRRGIMPERQSVLFMRQLASALAEAHSNGVIHRDLKPDNVFIIEDEEVELGERIKLLDFGIAKRIDPQQHLVPASEQTATGILVGTPAYMSPEQCKGLGSIDGRSDVYSLGVVLYRMLTNQLPFEASGTGELIGKHLYVEPESPCEVNPEISRGLEEIVIRCLQKEPADRFQTMSELANAFGELISSDVTRHTRGVAPPSAGDRSPDGALNTPSGRAAGYPESQAAMASPTPGAAVVSAAVSSSGLSPYSQAPLSTPIEEISATTLRTATGEQMSPAHMPNDESRGRNWPLWAAIGCIAAMLIGVVALSSGDGESTAETPSAAEGRAAASGQPTAGNGDKAATRLVSSDNSAAKAAPASEKAASEKAASEKAASEKAASEKAASEKAASEKAASEKAASEKAASEKAASEKAASEKAASEKAASERAASEKAASERAASEKAASEKAASERKAAQLAAAAAKKSNAAAKRAERERRARLKKIEAAEKAAAEKARRADEAKRKRDAEEKKKKKKTFDDVKTPMLY